MAPAGKHVSFLLLLVIISSVHTEARLGQFLTTYMYAPEPEPQGPTPAPSVSPEAAPVEGGFVSGPGLAPSQGNTRYDVNPYGGYNGNPTEFSLRNSMAAEVSSNKDEILGDEIANEKSSTEYNAGNQYYYTSNVDRYNYNDNNMANSNRGYSYSNNVYGSSGQKEVSNTRYSDNSKYSYDVNNEERNNNGNEAAEENRYNSEGFYGYGEKSKYENDNMEEYERQQGYPDTDRLYNP